MMEKPNDNLMQSENLSTCSDKKENIATSAPSQNKKIKTDNNSQYNNMYSNLIEILSSDKLDTDKIKALILLEQDFQIIKDKIKIFENYLNDTDCLNSNILKGQILMTSTTLLILLNAKDEYPTIFLNFVDNILIEHIKNTNNYTNIYLRQVSCQCLEEFENEYPGVLFSLMGKKTMDILEIKDFKKDDDKSVKSSLSMSKKPPRPGGKSEIPVFEHKKIELENDGLYNLIEEEMFYVFQYYLSLYTTIFKHLILYYFFHKFLKQFLNEDKYNQFINDIFQNPNISLPLNQTTTSDDKGLDRDDSMTDGTLQKGNEIIFNVSHTKNSNIFGILSNFPYLKSFVISSSTKQDKSTKSLNEGSKSIPFSNLNYQNLFISSKTDKILHIGSSMYSRYVMFFENFKYPDESYDEMSGIEFNQDFLSYVNKALSRIIHLLPKTGEMLQSKIWKLLKLIISRIEINHNALLPHFNYFHLNSNSTILTLTAIKIVENFKSVLKENFILKLVLKLCLLINDLRLNKALRILAIRWLLNLRSSNYNLNFNKYLQIISYYLSPSPFDSLTVCIEKLKTLFIFYETNNETDCDFIISSISIMDNYKYFPIFSNYVKSLFKAYLFIILRFPYINLIKKLCTILRDNLKEVPRILPNLINLLRIIKGLNDRRGALDFSTQLQKMTFDEIHKYLLIEFSKFISSFNSPTKLNNYFELFIEIAKENSIEPENLINGLRNLHNSIKDMRNWKIEKNILEVCRYLLNHHDLEIMKQNKIDELLHYIYIKSFDYGIRDKAKLYYELVTNVEKPILTKFLQTQSEFKYINTSISYDYIDFGKSLQNLVHLEQSKEERLTAKIEDGGSAIFDENFTQNVMLLSDCNNDNITSYSDFVYKKSISSDIGAKEMNDFISAANINKIIHSIITPSDIMRLYINDQNIDDNNDSQIDPKKIFKYDREFVFSGSDSLHDAQNNLETFLSDYFQMISKNKFYIKLPMNLYMKRSNSGMMNNNQIPTIAVDSQTVLLEKINDMYSINICFGKMSHLDIKCPILLPYLELHSSKTVVDMTFPYFYKIYLIVYPTHPIPSDVEVRAIFYDSSGICCTGMLNSVKINFEDFFLPISVPPLYRNIYNTSDGKIQLRQVIFKTLWKQFKSSQSNHLEFVNTQRMIDLDKEKVIKLVFQRLGPFLINDEFLKMSYIVRNPYSQEDHSSSQIDDPPTGEEVKVKDYYDKITGKFKTISYDFLMDEFLEKNCEKSYFVKHNKLKKSRYNLAEVLIFVPENFHILFKIKISEFSSIVEVRSNCLKIIEYLDEYFDTWLMTSNKGVNSSKEIV